MPEFKIEYLMAFAAIVLPGAITMYVYGLKVPQKEARLQERLLEAICFGIFNFVALFWVIQFLLKSEFLANYPFPSWILAILCFIVCPVFWPFVFVWMLRKAEARRWISVRAKTAWDDFFNRQERGFWVQVMLNDDRLVGGRFSERSYASSYPEPGHIFIEELWTIDQEDRFGERLDGVPGIILRPSDYKFVKVFTGPEGNLP